MRGSETQLRSYLRCLSLHTTPFNLLGLRDQIFLAEVVENADSVKKFPDHWGLPTQLNISQRYFALHSGRSPPHPQRIDCTGFALWKGATVRRWRDSRTLKFDAQLPRAIALQLHTIPRVLYRSSTSDLTILYLEFEF